MNIIVVTGASSGMGREFVKQLDKIESVDEIWVIARRKDRLEELSKIIKTPLRAISINLSMMEEVQRYKKMLEESNPNVCLLVNCAGFGIFDHYENISTETHLNMVDLNCKAVMAMIDFTLPYMVEKSKIINLVSCASFQPIPYINIYAATKAFMLSYSRALNVELKYRKITVTAVCPYWVDTEFFDRAIKPGGKPVVIKYGVMYKAENVVKKAIKDAYTGKDISVYGGTNKLQKFATKFLPHKFVMKVWINRQKLDGTKGIR